MTLTMDTLFGTVKHPKADALEKSRGAIPMPEEEKQRSVTLTAEILSKRGREALQSDDAAGNEKEGAPSAAEPVPRKAASSPLRRRPNAAAAS